MITFNAAGTGLVYDVNGSVSEVPINSSLLSIRISKLGVYVMDTSGQWGIINYSQTSYDNNIDLFNYLNGFIDIKIETATANTLTYFDANKYLKSLPTATYPSLTELSYVKGVTSAIQTQLDTKAKVLISTATASASATVDFTGLTTTYSKYIVEFYSVVPATDNTAMYMRIGTGAGPTYQTGATDYAWLWDGGFVGYGTTTFNAFSSADGDDDHIQITGGILTNTANISSLNGTVEIYNPSQTTNLHGIKFETMYTDDDAPDRLAMLRGRALYKSTTAITAIRFYISSGNVTSGFFKLYGLL